MMVISISSLTAGEEEGVKGASPSPGTNNSTNWSSKELDGSLRSQPKGLDVGCLIDDVVNCCRYRHVGIQYHRPLSLVPI